MGFLHGAPTTEPPRVNENRPYTILSMIFL